MLEARQIYRLLTFGFANLLANLPSFWCLAILPEIIVSNFGLKDPQAISIACGHFYLFFFLGLLGGTFIWPSLLRFISKRNAMLLGLGGMGFSNYLVGMAHTLFWFFAFRFLTGLFFNFNSVGKDFIFQFARPSHRQFCFSVKTLFGILGSFAGPYFGHLLYTSVHRNFREAMNIITFFFIFGLGHFIIVFFVDFTPGDAMFDLEVDEEEVRPILANPEGDPKLQKGLLQVLRLCVQNTYLRNLSIVYFLTNAVFKTGTIAVVLFTEAPWAQNGFGITSEQVATATFFSFFPAAFLVLFSPSFVPWPVSYKTFIRAFIFLMGATLIAFPLERDLMGHYRSQSESRVSLYLLVVYLACIPKVYSPFLNFSLNNAVDKYTRTALNSITFIFSISVTILLTSVILPIFSFVIFNPEMHPYVHWAKYTPFVLLNLVLAVAFIFIRHIGSQ